MANEKTPAAKTAKTVPGLRIAAKVAGFRRAGRAWSAEPVDLPIVTLTKAQVEALRAEPALVVADIEIAVGE